MQKNKSAWQILFSYLKDYEPSIVLLASLGIISALANGTIPYIIGSFFDALLNLSKKAFLFERGGIPLWLALLLLWIIVQLVANTVDWVIDKRGRVLRMAIHLGYQSRAFSHLLFLPISFHKDEKIGRLTEHISKASGQMAFIVENIIIDLAPRLLSVVVGIIVTAIINPLFTLIILIGVIIYILMLIRLLGPTSNLLKEGHSAWSTAYADAFGAVTNIQSVKHMAAELYEEQKIGKSFLGTAAALWKKIQFVWSNVGFYQRMIILATQTVIFFLSVYLIQQNKLTIGELMALNGYAALVFGPFVQLGFGWQTMQNGLASIRQSEERIFAVSHEIYHPKNAFCPAQIKGEVKFDDVCFSYENNVAVLRGLSFHVVPGETVAFVGKSGVGKSTTIDLISGYYFPQKGGVFVDGRNTREFDLTCLRKNIAIVPQEPVLFNDTILMNIKYGKLEVTNEEVIGAAQKAHIHEFIEQLPEKYNQLVGERGIKLSVGQKQRIAIARAILKNPAILILDEPTSALDAETEMLITTSLELLMKNRTTFIIAHRLSTVRRADRIFVFDQGKIVQEGKHSDLIKEEKGIYRQLYDYQIGLC